ncbi:hypothetical protein ABE26_16370 [Cytobacillus firmus]|nr:hypothetical protein [Cytobacillus firmus]
MYGAFMTTFFHGCFGIWASWSCYDDLFPRVLRILGFMEPLWRPFSSAALDFGLHEAVMTTFFLGCFGIWASWSLYDDHFPRLLRNLGFMELL